MTEKQDFYANMSSLAKECPDTVRRARQFAKRKISPVLLKELANKGIEGHWFVGEAAIRYENDHLQNLVALSALHNATKIKQEIVDSLPAFELDEHARLYKRYSDVEDFSHIYDHLTGDLGGATDYNLQYQLWTRTI